MLELGILKWYDQDHHRAGVQLIGSLTTYLDAVPVSVAIPPSAIVTGNRVLVALPNQNPRDACIIASWPRGEPPISDIPEHGNEKHNPDFATQADFSAHASRHMHLGDDRLKLLTNIIGIAVHICDWSTRDAWTDYVTGTGSVSWDSILQVTIRTGTTQDSIGALYTGICGALSPVSNGYPFGARIQSATSLLNSEAWVVAHKAAGTQFVSPTQNHVGWRILNGQLYASNGNGSNGIQTDTGVSLANQWAAADLLVVSNGSEINYYVNRQLKATHTTYLPSQWNYRCWCGIKNTEAADKVMRIVYVSWGREL